MWRYIQDEWLFSYRVAHDYSKSIESIEIRSTTELLWVRCCIQNHAVSFFSLFFLFFFFIFMRTCATNLIPFESNHELLRVPRTFDTIVRSNNDDFFLHTQTFRFGKNKAKKKVHEERFEALVNSIERKEKGKKIPCFIGFEKVVWKMCTRKEILISGNCEIFYIQFCYQPLIINDFFSIYFIANEKSIGREW